MKVGILSVALREGGGVFQYTQSLLEAMRDYSREFQFVQIRANDFPAILQEHVVLEIQRSGSFLKLKRFLHNSFNIQIGTLANFDISSLKDIQLIISPSTTFLPIYLGKPYIVTIHDFQHKYYPEFFSPWQRISRNLGNEISRRADLVVCESESVKRDLITFVRLGEDKIRVLASPPPRSQYAESTKPERLVEVERKYNLPDGFLFYPAQFWSHKNHARLIDALLMLRDERRMNVPLVLVGSKKGNFEAVMQQIEHQSLTEQVRYLGYVPEEDMSCLYKLCTALIVPSLFESISLPIWEAFHLGVPVVSSNVCGLPEQVADAGLLFDPSNTRDIAERIYKIWIDRDLRKRLARKGRLRIEHLTSEKYAKSWERVIKETQLRGSESLH